MFLLKIIIYLEDIMVTLYRISKWLLIALSSLIGLHAFYGGIALMIDSSGAMLGLSQHIENLPFSNDFFIFGLMLICLIGFSQIVTALLLLMHNNRGGFVAGFSAAVLLVWVSVQFFTLGVFAYPVFHFILAVVEIILGIILIVNYKKVTTRS